VFLDYIVLGPKCSLNYLVEPKKVIDLIRMKNRQEASSKGERGNNTKDKGSQSSRHSSSPTSDPILEFKALWSDSLIILGVPQRERASYYHV